MNSRYRGCLCECSHWDDRHELCEDEECKHEAPHIPCTVSGCGCTDLRPDREEMRERELEAKQLRYDAWRGK